MSNECSARRGIASERGGAAQRASRSHRTSKEFATELLAWGGRRGCYQQAQAGATAFGKAGDLIDKCLPRMRAGRFAMQSAVNQRSYLNLLSFEMNNRGFCFLASSLEMIQK